MQEGRVLQKEELAVLEERAKKLREERRAQKGLPSVEEEKAQRMREREEWRRQREVAERARAHSY